MRRLFLAIAACFAVSGAALVPAKAMTPGTVAGINAAIVDSSVIEDVRYVCRHRGYSSRRVCFFQPNRFYGGPVYRPYRGWGGGYRGYRGYRGGYRRW